MLFNFPNEAKNSKDFLKKDGSENQIILNSIDKEFTDKVSANTIINLDDLKEKNNTVSTVEPIKEEIKLREVNIGIDRHGNIIR